MSEESISSVNGSDLLAQFELILESDPLIDELGFIHPTQFLTLRNEAKDLNFSSEVQKVDDVLDRNDANFWIKDHKLGVSTGVLLPLYKAARDAFVGAFREYKKRLEEVSGCGAPCDEDSSFVSLERDVMEHSKSALLLSCDFGTAWNSRKFIVSKKQEISIFTDELRLSSLVLSYSHKSEQAWCHRRWVIKMIAGKCSTLHEIVGKESDQVQRIVERSKMNYRAWNHRCWLVSYMTKEQVLHELKKSRNWAGLHVADNSCFHYRTRLLRMLEEFCHKLQDESSDYNNGMYHIWQEELDWNEELIKRYVGREALWLYRRFLSLCWIRHFSTDLSNEPRHSDHCSSKADVFLENELHLVNFCSTIPDNDFEDFQAQAVGSATYILWLIKQIPESLRIKLQDEPRIKSLRTVLNGASPERSSLWNTIIGCQQHSE